MIDKSRPFFLNRITNRTSGWTGQDSLHIAPGPDTYIEKQDFAKEKRRCIMNWGGGQEGATPRRMEPLTSPDETGRCRFSACQKQKKNPKARAKEGVWVLLSLALPRSRNGRKLDIRHKCTCGGYTGWWAGWRPDMYHSREEVRDTDECSGFWLRAWMYTQT